MDSVWVVPKLPGAEEVRGGLGLSWAPIEHSSRSVRDEAYITRGSLQKLAEALRKKFLAGESSDEGEFEFSATRNGRHLASLRLA